MSFRFLHHCYLLGTIIHNPQKDSLPVIKNIQLASSKTITTLHDGSIPEANSITVIMFETDSWKSYQDASDQMIRWLQSNYCPSWIKERIKEAGPDFPDFERFKYMMSLTNDARKYVTRPIYSFAGAVLEDDLFNGTF